MPRRYWVELTDAELGVLRSHFATMVEANEIYAQDPSPQGRRQQAIGERVVAALDRARAAGLRWMIPLTPLEARALDLAQDNSTSCPDFVRDYLPGKLADACTRAVTQIQKVRRESYRKAPMRSRSHNPDPTAGTLDQYLMEEIGPGDVTGKE